MPDSRYTIPTALIILVVAWLMRRSPSASDRRARDMLLALQARRGC